MKLAIQNFQALKGPYELNFEPGVTMIVGSSSSGKTCIQRALRGLVLNYISSSKAKKYISHGENQLTVDLQLEESGPVYSWIKTEKGTQYNITVDNELNEFEKAGNDNLESICELADLPFPFVIRDKKLINTHTEKDSMPFPFDLNDVELFKMFEELYNVSSSGTIFKYMKSLETKTNSEIKSIKEDIEIDKTKIDKIIDLEEKYDIEKLEDLKLRAEKVQAGMLGIDEDIVIASRNNKTSKRIREFLESLPEIDNTEEKLDRALILFKESKDLQNDIRIINKNNEIEQINVYKKGFDTALIESYNALSVDLKEVIKLNSSLKEIDSEIEELLEEKKQIEEQLAKIDICPLCGNKIKEK